MDCIKLTLVALLLAGSVRAQTFAEWFSQKKTQKKYLLQQIAALQVYSGYLKTGYSIAKGGLGSITSYVGNEFSLHDGYYKHLNTVSIAVKNNPRVDDIIRWQQDILKQTMAIKKQTGLTANENNYAGKVCSALLSDCDARINDLQTILSDNKTEMSDEERLRQIGRLHIAMQDNYRFAANFRSQLQIYARNKQQEQQDNNTLRNLYANH
ncbi:hypothetical protein GWR56_13880 [Mucilaginibacter sp. 14171R-50]|uniref:hypothetical protein n=1 Tax=Mucilaginibacter sp. 14171R-50 TaxID=2703789 RepID=UPI00138CA8E4|nr:hypothetical protein [Mucilaginibacter sp. 14171R-50]QHS56579.1 hypothetical protein GWR56_13880 [Mucilaginibacter sp. 14171R-50]